MFRMDNQIYSFSKSGGLDAGYDINIWEAAHGNNAESTKDCGMLHDNSMFFLNDKYRNRVENITVSVWHLILKNEVL